MKKIVYVLLAGILAISAPRTTAQEKGKSEDSAKSSAPERTITPLRVQVVFTEYSGEKKISSLPYTLLVNADDRGPVAAIRMGLRVPIAATTGTGSRQYQYQNLGTNLDGRAEKTEDGRFVLKLNVTRSSAYTPNSTEKAAGSSEISSETPIIQEFSNQVNLLIRDGQTVQSTMATDPITGHVLKVDVTVNVIK